jgi:hypothetical protein
MIEVFDSFEQGTPEWHACRLGIPTASRFATVMAKGEGKTRREYMLKLLGERLTGEPAESYSNAHMERGRDMEAEARDMYEFMQDVECKRVGFVRNGDKGASPDSLVGDVGGCEIKTKLPHLQLDVLLRDRLPPEHVAQCQGFLWVAEREWVDFVSYWPKLPLFVKRVHRDEAYIKNLAAEVAAFNGELLAMADIFQPKKVAA